MKVPVQTVETVPNQQMIGVVVTREHVLTNFKIKKMSKPIKKSVKTYIKSFTNVSGLSKSVFASIKGGIRLELDSNKSSCNNSGDCTKSTNDWACSNTGTCV